jgi:hypothetical protein
VTESKPKYWGKLIAEQEAGKHKIGVFCGERGISEASFYYWRNRLRKSTPVRFALIQTPGVTSRPACTLELVLRNGERLRIGDQVDTTTLRMVLEAVRG